MISWLRDGSFRRFISLLTLVPIVILFGLLIFAPPDGTERAQLLQFFGRFHPLSVHLPIALLMLVPLLEFAGRTRHFPYLLPAAEFILGVATIGAIGAATLGWLLARNGGYSGPLVSQHMWGGVGVAAAAWLCWMLCSYSRPADSTQGSQRLYTAALIATVGLVSFTGYRGGQLSQGENHLTEFLPAPFDEWFGPVAQDAPANSPNGGASTFYGARIQPILTQNCVTCHGRSKHKSNLRLDSYESVMHGGKHGAVIRVGESKSGELLRRITLLQSDDDFMPPQNKRPLSATDVKLIEQWIAAGASGTLAADAIKDAPSNQAPVPEVAFEEIDPATVAKQRASLAPVLAELQQRFPNILEYHSRSSADIAVNAAWMGTRFGDSDLASLAPLNDRIVIADFSSTGITDKSAGAIAAMQHLQVLRLMHTRVTDTTVQALVPLRALQSLNLFGTQVTPSAFSALAKLPKLQRVYAGETKILSEAAVPSEIKNKIVF